MKKYRVYITQQVEEFLIVEVKAKNKKKAWKKAEKMRIEAESGDWDSCVRDIDFDFEQIVKE